MRHPDWINTQLPMWHCCCKMTLLLRMVQSLIRQSPATIVLSPNTQWLPICTSWQRCTPSIRKFSLPIRVASPSCVARLTTTFSANVVLVADDQQTLLARIMEILRDGTEYGAMMHFVPLPQACTVEDTRTGHDNTIISNLYIAFVYAKG